jgi:cytochrome c peroxidase
MVRDYCGRSPQRKLRIEAVVTSFVAWPHRAFRGLLDAQGSGAVTSRAERGLGRRPWAERRRSGPRNGSLYSAAMRLVLARRAVAIVIALALTSACSLGCEKKPTPETQPPPAAPPSASSIVPSSAPARAYDPSQLAVFAPLPVKIERPDNLLTDDKVALGKMLWFDPRLSKGQDVSCNTCHDVGASGADAAHASSSGTKKQKGRRNAPTIFNAAGGLAQGWDGRWPLVEDAVVPHAGEPSVMDIDEKHLVDTVASIPGYAPLFGKAFPSEKGGVTAEKIAKAVGAFTRRLLTPSRWDAFLRGDEGALTSDEKAGLGAFMDASCTTCHAGKYVGAAQNQKLGIAKPWPPAAGAPDVGRFEVTKEAVDSAVFKVPTLRNVTKTAPYLHDGSVASLDELTKMMARHQVGRELTDAQARSIVTFLGALEGEPPKDLVTKPSLPPSGPKTPKPE